jgi:hypothetical protein
MAWMVAGAVSTGGSGALVAKTFRKRKNTKHFMMRRTDDGNGDHDKQGGITGGVVEGTQGTAEEGKGIYPAA